MNGYVTLGQIQAHYLVGHNVLARFYGLDRLWGMDVVGGGQHDQIHTGSGQHLFKRGISLAAALLFDLFARLGIARRNAVQIQPRREANEITVKAASGIAIADDGCFEREVRCCSGISVT